MKMRKRLAAVIVTLALGAGLLSTGCGSTAAQAGKTEAAASYDKAQEYLQDYYGIEPGQEATLDSVNEMVKALGGKQIDAEKLTDGAVIEAGLKIAGLDELALTYINDEAPDKAAEVLKKAGITTEDEYAPYVACAVDLDKY